MIDAEQIDPFVLPSIAIEDRASMPWIPAIYFAISSDDRVLYIGQTCCLRTRWMYHGRLDQLKAFDGVRVAWLSLHSSMPDEEVRRITGMTKCEVATLASEHFLKMLKQASVT